MRDDDGSLRGGTVDQLIAHLAEGDSVPERSYIQVCFFYFIFLFLTFCLKQANFFF